MNELSYPGKGDIELLRNLVRDSIDDMEKLGKELGYNDGYFTYAKSALETAIEKMESDLYQLGIAKEEKLPFEPEDTDEEEQDTEDKEAKAYDS